MKEQDAGSAMPEEVVISVIKWKEAIYKTNHHKHPDDCDLYTIEKMWGLKFLGPHSPVAYRFNLIDKQKFLLAKITHGF